MEQLELLKDEEVLDLTENLENQLKWLRTETVLFQRYLLKLQQFPNAIGNHKQEQQQLFWSQEEKKKQHQQQDMQLTLQQKIELVLREHEELKEEGEKIKDQSEKDIDHLESEIEELEHRLSDMERAEHEFKRDIEKGSVNERTGKVAAEKYIRYFEERMRVKEAEIEKTRLRNVALRNQLMKMKQQLKQKEETGESLTAIDFDQLSIENAQYQAKIDEKNEELLKLKTSSAGIIQVLNRYKEQLASAMEQHTKYTQELASRKEIFHKLKQESSLVRSEIEKTSLSNKSLVDKMDEYRVPDIMKYVSEKAKLGEQEQALKVWKRKVEIQEAALKRFQNKEKQVRQQSSKPQTAQTAADPISVKVKNKSQKMNEDKKNQVKNLKL